MKPTTLNSFLIAIKTELKEAEGKHPKFCDEICDREIDFGGFAEYYKIVNDNSATHNANHILYEEVMDAMDAYNNKDYKQALKELAQCGAVILRMMEFVKKQVNR